VAGDDPLLGRVISGKFRVERVLGQGAMGRVYLAEQTNLGKQVAIKVLHANMAGDAALEKRFHREAKSASILSHPNIVQTIDFGQEEGLLFIAMELLSGRDLGQVIKKEWPFPPERLAQLVGQVLSALAEAHEKGVVHRDLKPENIMLIDVRGEDFVKVCDFGIAKLASERDGEGSAITMAGMVCGTPEYMSPEQARGDSLDGRSDLWSVAVMLYQMTTGELPFRAETALGVVTRVLNEQPLPPSKKRPGAEIPPSLETLILRGLEKDRERRFANATAMRDALFEAVGLKRSGSGQVRARPAGAADPQMALADTGVATPSSQPALMPTQVQSGSVHGEMAAAGAPAKKLPRLLIAGGGALLLALAVVAGRPLLRPIPKEPPPAVERAVEEPRVQPPPPAPPVAIAPTVSAPVTAVVVPPPAQKKKHHEKAVAAPAPPEHAETKAAEPKAEPHKTPFAEAEQQFKSGNVDGALAKYLEAAKADPRDALTQRQIGKCYNRLGQRDKAQPYLRRYLELRPDASDAAFIRAMIQ
jgi:tRNA A-37 threonylcarbamoyl transferase component Bud32